MEPESQEMTAVCKYKTSILNGMGWSDETIVRRVDFSCVSPINSGELFEEMKNHILATHKKRNESEIYFYLKITVPQIELETVYSFNYA